MARPHPATCMSNSTQSKRGVRPGKSPKKRRSEQTNTPSSKASRSIHSGMGSQAKSTGSAAHKQGSQHKAPDVGGDHGSSEEDTETNEDDPSNGPPSQVAMTPTQTGADRWQHLDVTIHEGSRDKRTIEVYVKENFFSKCKFIRDKSEMEYSIEMKSICQTVCKGCNIQLEKQQEWWQFAKKVVERNLNKKRADVNCTMKRIFGGKLAIPRNNANANMN